MQHLITLFINYKLICIDPCTLQLYIFFFSALLHFHKPKSKCKNTFGKKYSAEIDIVSKKSLQ